MTIEEAWAAHDQAVEDYGEGIRLDVGLEAMCALEEDEERTMLAAMLAVLEEAALLGGDQGVELTAEYQALRRRIEELGR